MTLSSVLQDAAEDGAIGVAVTGTVPVTATLRSVVDGDLSHAVAVTSSAEPMTALVPSGAGSVVLADADRVGTVTVTSFAGDGRRLGEETVEVRPAPAAPSTCPAMPRWSGSRRPGPPSTPRRW